MKTPKNNQQRDEEGQPPQQSGLPYPDSDWSPALQRTIKRKLENDEIDEVDANVFYGMVGQISQEKDGQK